MGDGTPAKVGRSQALAMVREIASRKKGVALVGHARTRMEQRGITRRQVASCLQKGVITEGPFLNNHGNWQVNVSRLAAGEQITCVVAIEWGRRLIVISAFED
jgi:hypothetical protein